MHEENTKKVTAVSVVLYRMSKKNLIPFIFKLAASRQEFDRSCLNISWVHEAYQKSEPIIILKQNLSPVGVKMHY